MSQISITSPLDKPYPITTDFTGKVILGPRTGQQHNALDYSTPQGTPIYAVADAKVTRADAKDIWGGNIIQLDNSTSGLTAIYAHLSKMLVVPGQTVHQGDLIGYTGGAIGTAGSGQATTGPHLYFETRINGTPVDPKSLISGVSSNTSSNTTDPILVWLNDFFKSNPSYVNNSTWNDFAQGFHAEFINSPVNSTKLEDAIGSLGLGNAKINPKDFSKIASQITLNSSQDNGILGIPGAITDAAYTLGIIFVAVALIIGAFLLLRSNRE